MASFSCQALDRALACYLERIDAQDIQNMTASSLMHTCKQPELGLLTAMYRLVFWSCALCAAADVVPHDPRKAIIASQIGRPDSDAGSPMTSCHICLTALRSFETGIFWSNADFSCTHMRSAVSACFSGKGTVLETEQSSCGNLQLRSGAWCGREVSERQTHDEYNRNALA